MSKVPSELSNFKHCLLRDWLYAPTALVGATLMALALTRIHPFWISLPITFCLFSASLFMMSKIKSLEFKYEQADLLDKMKKFGGGLILPVGLKDLFNFFSGHRFDVWTNIAIDFAVPVFFAPYWVLFTRQKKPLKKAEIKL